MVRSPKALRKYQWKGIYFGLARKLCALFLDMGLGKTIIVLSIIKALLMRGLLKKPVLIVGPIRVIETVWRQEAALWKHTRDLKFSLIRGNPQQRLEALHKKAHIYLINPESLVWLLSLFQHKKALESWPWAMLVVDESSAFKAPGSKRFRKLRNFIWLFERRMVLTGTPMPNSLLEIWPQFFIVDEGARLGETFGSYKGRFFTQPLDTDNLEPDDARRRIPFVPREGSEEYINDLIGDVTLRMEAADWLDMPPTVYNNIDVIFDEETMALYEQFEDEMFFELDNGVEVDAVHAGALRMKCHQFANGAIYYREDGELPTARQRWRELHTFKTEAIQEITEGTGGNVMICFQYRHDLERLQKIYPDAPVIGRQTAKRGKHHMPIVKLIEHWNEGRFPELLIHPKSGGHGLNMQYGGRTIAFFSLTDSYESYDQVINRIGGARAQGKVTVHNLKAVGTVDEVILGNIADKATGQNTFLRRLKEYRHAKVSQR